MFDHLLARMLRRVSLDPLYPLGVKCLTGLKNLAKSAVGPVLTTLESCSALSGKPVAVYVINGDGKRNIEKTLVTGDDDDDDITKIWTSRVPRLVGSARGAGWMHTPSTWYAYTKVPNPDAQEPARRNSDWRACSVGPG